MALPRQQLPKFGDWTDPDAAFTVVFEKASRSKKDTDVSNPKEYPEMNPNPPQNRNHGHVQPQNHNVRPSPAHNERNMRVRSTPHKRETYNHQPYGDGGRSLGNPSEINRRQPHDPPPVQTRPIPNVRGRISERVATTIPPFPVSGSDNQSYTLIFEKVKEDKKQSGTLRSYNGSAHSTPIRPIDDQHHQQPSSPKGSCCFPPWR